MKRVTIILLLVIATFLFAQTFSGTEYYPMGVGYVWSYTDSFGSDSEVVRTTRIVNQTVIDSYPAWEFVTTTDGSDSADTTYDQLREDGIYILFTLGSFERYLKLLPTEFALGDTWEVIVTDTTVDTMGMSVDLHVEGYGSAENTEDVSTTAGDFDDCVRVIFTAYVHYSVPPFYEDSDTTVVLEYWLAHFTGIVRAIQRDPNPMSPGPEIHSWLREYDLTKVAEVPLPQIVKFEAYPNPFNSACVIRMPSGIDKIIIADISGRTITEINHPGTIAFWEPSADIPAGIYLAHAVSDGRILAAQKLLFVK